MIDPARVRAEIERWVGAVDDTGAGPADPEAARAAVRGLLEALSQGAVRSAEPGPDGWQAVDWVKEGILLAFRVGATARFDGPPQDYFDRDTLPLRATDGVEENVRIVPGGTSVRHGAFLGPGVVIMPPAYINVGAYVGEGTMIDSHALVGSCAQIGARVHLSAGAQIGGVLEPVGLRPVIVEDEVVIGGNAGVFEGTLVGRRAIIAPGVSLTASTPLYDLVHGRIYRAEAGHPLNVPPGAVVVPGSRPASGPFASEHGLQLYAPVIVKYRDEKTDAATALETALR
ncbi:MAG: 2,3,4,5-tetrahydropyridine-2,6-dicarboxylate N-succinyltransferase [Gemmatimonadetes bacterium]|nr:2,3,4,5-tetrahydropyridine-2,6-dicarboxylate N-succinyltransferase [Gemmatimonadota bacterium]NIQ51961.1 2,3,4,5-tetrahydropyridine-2,6-dicarboxylate N-succinyltransferase [Gemmatimonadota bacterium]NIU72064.1 2,3,4,5-tetrahydropyridine-2,6-dicarboxylate N-succinyltransferase [Gammaproteobacteria bacterium]NIX42624.1 2,3,4,5-tetrahydropyridine-2,6-dicarboxylate N-succinyltransferase [Gemmatimonadota bacterium]